MNSVDIWRINHLKPSRGPTYVELLQKPISIVPAPGCDVKVRMVESRRLKERPHLVTPGKGTGEDKCEKNCPHYNAIHICSHAVVTAQSNGELLDFLKWFQQSPSKKATNLCSVVKTDMPKYPGRCPINSTKISLEAANSRACEAHICCV